MNKILLALAVLMSASVVLANETAATEQATSTVEVAPAEEVKSEDAK